MLQELLLKNRSYRRFEENHLIETQILKDLINLARFSPSSGNLQPLKYMISNDPVKNSLIFPNLGWARYLENWNGPSAGEKPSAYILILGDTQITNSFGCDDGIAAQNILLGAVEQGLGGCMISSIYRENIQQALQIPIRYQILLIIALGKPKEQIIIEPIPSDGNIKYWRDHNQIHHVPKRRLDDIIVS
ncbi:MAG: nitroreductase family protein [Candidatus Aureabacteria bacterium]|nr:nitroreductase family protein [Candidatus Auribacterota bacterium]